jgi:hypothetical protein
MWRVQYLTPDGPVWHTYYADEVRARKIAESMAKRRGWKVKQVVREW